MSRVEQTTDGRTERRLMARVRRSARDWEELLPTFPVKLQVQTASPCNAACIMCPWPETAATQDQGFMDEALYAQLVDELRERPAGGAPERVGLFLMNEPLLDRRLPDWTARMRAALPDATLVIYTNGALLDGERALALAEAGMSEIHVSVVGLDRDEHARNMPGVRWETLLSNLAAVRALLDAGTLGAMRVRVVGLDFPEALARRAEFERETGFPVALKALTTRAGAVDLDGVTGARRAPAPYRACQRPFVKAYVLYDGRVVLCNCDWRRTTVVGDLRRESLSAVWRGERLQAIRARLAERRLEPGSLCAGCDYPYLR